MLKVMRAIRNHWLVWAYLVLTFVTFVIVFFYEPSANSGPEYDRHVRLLALSLQLLGTATVWWDLTHTAKEHGAGPSFRKAWESIKSAFGVRPPPTRHVLTVEPCEIRITGGRVGIWQQPQTVEARLANLEHFVRRLDSDLGNIHGAMTEQSAKQTADLKQLGKDLRRENKKLEAQLTEALIGNFATLHFGVIWLVVGMVLAAVPVELTDIAVRWRLFDLLR